MAEIGGFYKPQLKVSVGGRSLKYHALYFDSFGPWNLLELVLQGKHSPKVGDRIKGIFSWDDGPAVDFFVCDVESISPAGKGASLIRAVSPYQRRMGDKLEASSWRSAAIEEVFLDLLDAARIDEYDLSALPALTIDRFSTAAGMTVGSALEHLVAALADSEGRQLVIRPAPNGKITIGYPKNIRISIGAQKIAFKKGVNILGQDRNHITSFALPVLSNQVVSVDDQNRLCVRSRITCRPAYYRLGIEVGPA